VYSIVVVREREAMEEYEEEIQDYLDWREYLNG